MDLDILIFKKNYVLRKYVEYVYFGLGYWYLFYMYNRF